MILDYSPQKQFNLKWVSIAFAACLSAAFSLSAKQLYVSTNGSDHYLGTFHKPFRTITKGIESANPGDTVNILEGFYAEAVVVSGMKGTAKSPLLIRGLGKVVISTQNEISLNDPSAKDHYSDLPLSNPNHLYFPYYIGALFRLHDCTYVTINNIEVENSAWFGFSARFCENLTIRNCKTRNTQASGIYILDSQNVKIAYNEITRACARINRIGGHGSQECLSLVNTKHFEVAYNRVHESGTWEVSEPGGSGVGGEGIDVKEGSAHGTVHHNYVYNLSRCGLYVDAWASDLEDVAVYNNVVHDCMHGQGLGCEGGGTLKNIRIYNNLFYDNIHYGVGISSWGEDGEKDNILISNNTIYRNGNSGIELGSERHKNIEVLNNILYQNHPQYEGDSIHKGNLTTKGAKNVVIKNNLIGEDPQFMDLPHGDFRLKASSPAIDAGTAAITIEIDGNDQARVSGNSIDLGAFEFQQQ